MGLILDSSAIIAGERKGHSAADVLSGIRAVAGPEPAALSVMSVIELEHGIWRAKNAAQASARQEVHERSVPSCSGVSSDVRYRAPRGADRGRGSAKGRRDSVPGSGDRSDRVAVQLRGCNLERPALP